MGTIKVAILEKDGEEFDAPTEFDLEAAIVYIGHNNFSYKRIASDKTILIPEDQQMIVKQSITIEGQLAIAGELVII